MDKSAQAAQALQLRDIHLPQASIWPLAPGWWFVIIITLILAYFIVKKIQQRKKLKALNNLMQLELSSIRENYKNHHDKHQLASDISQLLKRFVRHVVGNTEKTSLTGDAWIDYLNSLANSDEFNQHKQALTQAQYSKGLDYDVSKLIATLRNFFPKVINTLNKKPKGGKNA